LRRGTRSPLKKVDYHQLHGSNRSSSISPFDVRAASRHIHSEGIMALKRRIPQALVAILVAILCTFVTARPASAAIVIPVGQSGHACGAYKQDNIWLIKWQGCAWASWNPSGGSRLWFTGHFANRSSYNLGLAVDVGYYIDGQYRFCYTTNLQTFIVPAGGTRATESERCWIPRRAAAVQASIVFTARALSPTLNVRG
jgi:hypothetical protein